MQLQNKITDATCIEQLDSQVWLHYIYFRFKKGLSNFEYWVNKNVQIYIYNSCPKAIEIISGCNDQSKKFL